MSRDLTGLVTHENSGVAGNSATSDVDENSDVAGYAAAAVVDVRRVASSTIELPRCETVESQKLVQVPVAPLYCACFVGRGSEAPQPTHLSGDEAVTVTMPVVLLDDFSLTFLDNTTGEDNMLTIVLSDNNNTTCNLGYMASVLTECVRVHGAMSELFNKFSDHKNVTFRRDRWWTGQVA